MQGRARRFLRAPVFYLGLLVAGYFAVSVSLSYLRFEELASTNWDLGIFQQSLWSTLHGRTFYEAGDWETYGVVSLLQVHPALLLYLVVPFYSLSPTALTLFVLQSGAVALAAVPMYLTGRKVIGRPAPALLIAALYLTCAPLLLANLYDFHLESFLPLELSLLYYLWLTGRYRWGLLVATAACLTLEVVPFLVAAVALVFLLPPIRRGWARWRTRSLGWRDLTGYLARREVRWAALLLFAALAAYPMLRLFEWQLLPHLLGVPTAVPAPTGPGTVRSNLLALGFDFSYSLAYKLRFWVLLVGLFAFLPAFAPRTLILSAPWFLYTLQAGQISWTTLGFQYAFVPMAGLVLAAIYGFRALDQEVLPWLHRYRDRRRPSYGRIRSPWSPHPPRRLPTAVWIAVAVTLLATNFLAGPIDPYNQNLASSLPGYRVAYTVPPGFGNARAVSALVPAGATVLASTDLFPLVANDLNAYALMWTAQPPPILPFGPNALPGYVLVSNDFLFSVPGWLADRLVNASVYGLLAETWVTPSGPVFLWQLGASAPARQIGALPTGSLTLVGGALGATGIGVRIAVPAAPATTVVRSTNVTGAPFLNTTGVYLPAGSYEATIDFRMNGSQPPPAAGVASIVLTAFGGVPSSSRVVPASILASGAWTNISFRVDSVDPILAVHIAVSLLLDGITLEVAEVVVRPASPGPTG